MKKLYKTLASLILLTFLSCGDDDNTTPPQTNNFIVNGISYQALNASLGLDAGPSYNNQFSLILTDNLINVNTQNVPTISTSTTAGIAIFVKLGATPLVSE